MNWFVDIVNRFLSIILWPLFTTLVVIMFLYAGFMFLTANGEPGKIDAAKKAVIWAIVGVAVGILAFSLVGIVRRLLGLPPA